MTLLDKEPVKRVEKSLKLFDTKINIIILNSSARTAKEAALSLTVTPSIIGDGNVLLDIQVNNDAPKTIAGADEPGISTNEIKTKLLVTDGDIVVIGGIKKNTKNNTNTKTPGISDVPVVGNLFKGKNKTDELKELLIFIAPRVIQ